MISCSLILFSSQFADDSTITYSSLSYEDAKKTIENEFKLVLEWLAANKLIINIKKNTFHGVYKQIKAAKFTNHC